VLRAQLTEATRRRLAGAPGQGRSRATSVPGIHAFNFVCEQALGGGGMASLRNDPLGKGMAQILLADAGGTAGRLQPPTRALHPSTQGDTT
jgi:hypothetical protein